MEKRQHATDMLKADSTLTGIQTHNCQMENYILVVSKEENNDSNGSQTCNNLKKRMQYCKPQVLISQLSQFLCT